MEVALNKGCHGEERSDVAIHLEYQMDCRARPPGLAMTEFEETTGFGTPFDTSEKSGWDNVVIERRYLKYS